MEFAVAMLSALCVVAAMMVPVVWMVLLLVGGISSTVHAAVERHAARERALLANGVPAPATVVALQRTESSLTRRVSGAAPVAGRSDRANALAGDLRRVFGYQVLLEVVPADGAPYIVRIDKFLSLEQLAKVQPDRVVEVRCDPTDRQHVAIVGL